MTITATGNNSIDALLAGESWLSGPAVTGGASTVITYSFMTSNTDGAKGFLAMNSAQQQAAVTALATWASVANIQFKQVTSGGEIQFGTADLGSGASGETDWNYGSNGVFTTNYVYLNNTGNYTNKAGSAFNLIFTPGSYAPSVLIHEIGHALGLKHPGDYDGTPPPYLYNYEDNRDYSVMSYNDGAATSYLFNKFSGDTYSITPMLLDIQAIQYLYGANSSNTGDTVYRFTDTSAPQCIWDAGGNNSFDFSACFNPTIINLNPGSFSSTDNTVKGEASQNINIAYGTQINTAIASVSGSLIYCNSGHDTITGGAGNDTIYLGSGTATVDGKGGSNVVVIGQTDSLIGDIFTNIQTLDLGYARTTMTVAQYSQFATIKNGDGGVTFADAGTITANPNVLDYNLADGTNILNVTQPLSNTFSIPSISILGASSGSDLYDIRGAHIATTPVTYFAQLYIYGNGAQDTLELSGSASDYLFFGQTAPYFSGATLQIKDTVAARDGLISTQFVQHFQFTDVTIADTDPLFAFIFDQNSLNGTGALAFRYGIAGTATNNVIGEESADLGSGYNAVILPGAKSQYDVSADSSGALTITDNSSHQTYSVTGDHYLIFDNAAMPGIANDSYQEMDFVFQGTGAQIVSLYNAAFGRQPDIGGLEFYVTPISQGTQSLYTTATYFINSPEFQRLYPAAAQPADNGGPNDQAFIASLYQNVLHRTPSASEVSFYSQDLQGTLPGVPQQDRAQLLIYFSLSAENQKDISGWLI